MRKGWEGNDRLQELVRRVDSGADLVAEVVVHEDEHVIATKSQWEAGSTPVGSVEHHASGGVTPAVAANTAVSHTTDTGATYSNGELGGVFGGLLIQWMGVETETRIVNQFTARIDPRANGGNPKTVDHFVIELYRVARYENETVQLELLGRSDPLAATGEVAADFTFPFTFAPSVGGPPEGGTSRPETVIRLLALRADGSAADNVAWLGDAGQGGSKTDGSTYDARTYLFSLSTDGTYVRTSTGGPFPRFTLQEATYVTAAKEFTGASDIDDMTGSGPIRIVARGETPGGSTFTLEIDDGGGYVECFDGDVIGVDNTPNGGADLSGVSTTGPWDMYLTLTPSANGLSAPTVREIGVEQYTETLLAGAARVRGGAAQVNPTDLITNIAAVDIEILKTGEKDFEDYGSLLLSQNHIGQIAIRVWVGDPSGALPRRYWMLHSVWDVEDYISTGDAHVIAARSPLRRARRRIPPFVATTGNDGKRIPFTVSGTLKACYDELIGTHLALASRFIGPGVEDATTTALKFIDDADGKDELDAVAFLDGSAVIESQGRLKAAKVMRDNPAADKIVARYPLGSYTPGVIGPGYGARTDEYFVKYNWETSREVYDNERRIFNAIAQAKLGGSGLDTTDQLRDNVCRWVSSEALAVAIGERYIKHFANGEIVWELRDCERNPQLEVGDVVVVETDQFVGRSPITDEAIRGHVMATGIVIRVADPWARAIDVWVPSFDYIAPTNGDVSRAGFGVPEKLIHIDTSSRSHTGNTSATALETFQIPPLYQQGKLYAARARGVFESSGAGGTKTVRIEYGAGIAWEYTMPTGDQVVEMEILFEATGPATIYVTDLKAIAWPTQLVSNPYTVDVAADLRWEVTLANAGDSAAVTFSEVRWTKKP